MKKKIGYAHYLSSDIPAGIVVFLISVPLCLGIALASGAPLFSGIVSGIIGGVVVGAISGSQVGVSGPAAGLAVIVFSAISKLGSFEIFLVAVVLAGVIQVVFGLFKAGVIGYYFPSAVIKGMLSGIGIIIFLKQIPHAIGYDKDPEGDLAFVQPDGHNTLSELAYMLEYVSPGAIVVSILSIFILIFWDQAFMKRIGIFRIIQGPLVVVLIGIGFSWIFASSEDFAISADHLVNLPVAHDFGGFLRLFTMPDFSAILNKNVLVLAFTIAVVASLETLLCLEAADKLDPYKRISSTNRELLAQGVGNITAGLIGGLPITQVIVRSSANIQSGGKTKVSTIVHGLLLLFSALLIPGVLNLIPLASLASILLVIGYKLAKPRLFAEMYRKGSTQFLPFLLTVAGLIFTDLLVGIGLGMIVAVLQILWNNYKTPYHFDPAGYREGEAVRITLSEDVTFLNKASIMQTLEKMPDGAKVVIDGRLARNIHPDVCEIIEDFRENAVTRDITVEMHGFEGRENGNGAGRRKDVLDKAIN